MITSEILGYLRTIALLSIFPLLFFSCNSSVREAGPSGGSVSSSDSILAYNRQVVAAEQTEIEDFIARYHWTMSTSPTGLRYMIYKEGKGRKAVEGDRVEIRYRATLLNGNLVAQTDPGAPFIFELAKRRVISGLEEGILLMKEGAHAKLIVPSHLAYGLLGDPSGVPAGAALVYDVELCSVLPHHR